MSTDLDFVAIGDHVVRPHVGGGVARESINPEWAPETRRWHAYHATSLSCPCIDSSHRDSHRGRWNDRGSVTRVEDYVRPDGSVFRVTTHTPMWSGVQGTPTTKIEELGAL